MTLTHDHAWDSPFIYDNGCTVCDAIRELEAIFQDNYILPPWVPPENREIALEEQSVALIEYILEAHSK